MKHIQKKGNTFLGIEIYVILKKIWRNTVLFVNG
jgi:hypothetical protein